MMKVALRVHEPSSIFLIRKGGANALVSLYFSVFWLEFDFKVEVVDKRIGFFYNYVIFLRIS
jgi:hypothetical protein